MIILEVLNIILIITCAILIYLHLVSLKKIHKMMDINEIKVKLDEIDKDNKLYIRDTDCHIRKFHIHSAIQNNIPVLIVDLI